MNRDGYFFFIFLSIIETKTENKKQKTQKNMEMVRDFCCPNPFHQNCNSGICPTCDNSLRSYCLENYLNEIQTIEKLRVYFVKKKKKERKKLILIPCH